MHVLSFLNLRGRFISSKYASNDPDFNTNYQYSTPLPQTTNAVMTEFRGYMTHTMLKAKIVKNFVK